VYNDLRLGEEADYYHKCSLEAQMFAQPQMFHRRTKPAFLPNRCYAFVLFRPQDIIGYDI